MSDIRLKISEEIMLFIRITTKTIKAKNKCWEIKTNIQKNGYAKISWNKKACWAHRLSYELFKGPIPKKMDVCHSCDNRKCVNPSHLFVGTRRDNMVDCKNKKRISSGLKHSVIMQKAFEGKRKLSDENVLSIIKSTETNRELAKKFNVHNRLISLIKENKIYKHVRRNHECK